MAKGKAVVRLGLGSGGGMSVTTCDGADGDGATGGEGGASSAVTTGLRSGRGTTEDAVATSDCGVTVCGMGAVIGAGVDGFRSGSGSVSLAVVAGFRSGSGAAPVTAREPVADAGADWGEASGASWGGACSPAVCAGEVSCAGAASATGAPPGATAARSGLRSGRDGWISGFAAFAVCAGFAVTCVRDLAIASAGARHARKTSNSKMRARMRFISSIGYRLRSCVLAVRTSPEPGSRDDDGSLVCLI